MKNADYWRQRALALEAGAHQSAEDYWQTAQVEFDKASRRLQDDIAVWYQRFADNNQISLTEAKRLLNTRELEEFRWTVEDYIKAGERISPQNLDQALMKQLENASAKVHISRLEALQTQLQAEVELLYGNHIDGLERLLGNVYEGNYYRTAYEIQKGTGVGWSLNRLDTRQIQKALETPWTADSVTFRDSCWKNKRTLVGELRTQLTQGIIRGDNPAEAAKAIEKRFGVEKSKAARLCYTESAHISALSQKDCYKELGVERFEIVETLDSTTCSACGSLDGKIFPMGQYEVGVTVPPFHPNCRGCTAPFFEDLDGERIARDANDKHYYVPANTTYEQWKKGFVDNQENMGKLFRLKDDEGTFMTINLAGNDVIKPRNIQKNLNKTQIGRETLEYIQENQVSIRLLYGVDNERNIYGSYDPIDDVIKIYADSTQTVQKTAEVIIHEVTHKRYAIGNSQWAEAVCVAQEVKHRKNSNSLTIQDKRDIVKEVKELYPNYPWKKR